MEKTQLLSHYSDEDKLVLAKVLDKMDYTKTKNKLSQTDFLDERQLAISEKLLKSMKIDNYILYGGFENAQRKCIFFYPEKLEEVIKSDTSFFENYISIIRITVPKNLIGEYEHKTYLGAIMKLGVKREKVGDILFDEYGADIFLIPDISNYIIQGLKQLTRFQKSQIENIEYFQKREAIINKEKIEILVSSLRLDCIVAELTNSSRTKANIFIQEQRVFLNHELVQNESKSIKIGDEITIRGKGKFIISEYMGLSKKEKKKIMVEKYV